MPLRADVFRVGIFHTELERKAPGLLYRDIVRGKDDVQAAIDRIVRANADILVLLDFDFDYHLVALKAFAKGIHDSGGPDYAYQFAQRPNTGMPSGLDLNNDGRLGTPKDTHGYGRFSGQGGMAVLSRFPITAESVENFSNVIWADLPWAELPQIEGAPFLTPEVAEMLRLSTTGHWVVPVQFPNGARVHLLTYHATPPAFDGAEDLNGLRNADETRFWLKYLETNQPENPIVVGGANLDPLRGDGRRGAIKKLLTLPMLQDPFDESTITVDWTDIDLGEMRTDYVLPSADLFVREVGTLWPLERSDDHSRHAIVWADIEMPSPAAPVMLETSAMTQ